MSKSTSTEAESAQPSAPWYAKFFEYWRNRNRIGPGKVELPDCDFFIVAPRRTLRVLRPTISSGAYYESRADRPESINANVITRWTKRPHSTEHCRCSFRMSNRLSTTEERIITAELNRIRTSLCEADISGQDIDVLEQEVSENLQKLQTTSEFVRDDEIDEAPQVFESEEREEKAAKNKIVKELERYINALLEEILDDTVKFIGGSVDRSTMKIDDKSKRERPEDRLTDEFVLCDGERSKESEKSDGEQSSTTKETFNNINFSFHEDDDPAKLENECGNVSAHQGYVNRAFIGTTNDPDSLDFYLHQSVGMKPLEHLDCVDSGINSVETIEFQPDQEPSLEQSLLRIIDEKLGRTPVDPSRLDAKLEEHVKDEISIGERVSNLENALNASNVTSDKDPTNGETSAIVDISTDNLSSETEDFKDTLESTNDAAYEKSRLDFGDGAGAATLNTESNPRGARRRSSDDFSKSPARSWQDKLGSFDMKNQAGPIELRDYRRKWPEVKEIDAKQDRIPREFVTFRKNKKPTIVFLHGFGSSAECFEHQLQYFASLGYPCIAPDMLGHGMSSAPDRKRDYRFDKLLRDLDALLQHYAFKSGHKCVLVAHNYGCSFAAALAQKYESEIAQLVLISGGGPTPLAPPSTESTGHCCLRAILAPFLMCGLHRDILYSARGRQHPYCGPESDEQWPSHMKYVLNGMVWPEGDYVFHRRICTPTLLVHGLRDNKVSLVQECQMERTMGKAFLEAIPAAGHSPMIDCSNQLNHMIHCFIDLCKNKKL